MALRTIGESAGRFRSAAVLRSSSCASAPAYPARGGSLLIASTNFRNFLSVIPKRSDSWFHSMPGIGTNAAWVSLCRAWINTDELVTRQKSKDGHEYQSIRPAYFPGEMLRRRGHRSFVRATSVRQPFD